MFYIVETDEQLNELFDKDYDKVFVEPIYYNDNIHPSLNHISLLYIKPLNNDKGYMVCTHHTEALELNKTPINRLLASFTEVYVRDRKSFIYRFPLKNIIDISFGTPEYAELTTQTHDFFYQKHGDVEDINTIIPLVKHYERCELVFDKVKEYCIKSDNTKFHNKLTSVFFAIERNGIKINKDVFNEFFKPNTELYSIQDSKVYTQYNLYTTTGRPSNSFNGINFAALKKEDGCREAFTPENDCFIEIDISAYHPTLAAHLIKYDFGDETPYQYFAKEADIEVDEAKILMFRQLYGGIYKEYQHIEYFQLIQKHTDKLWKDFKTNGFIECPISGHKFKNNIKDINPQKLFNYTLQNLETSTNVLILWDIIKLLKGKTTNIVLYTYDSILLDYAENDSILEEIQQIFTKYNLKTKTTKGHNYGNMK
jgi:hypothetical protein